MAAIQIQIGAYENSIEFRPILEVSNFSPVLIGAFVQSPTSVGDIMTLSLSPAFDIDQGDLVNMDQLDISVAVDGLVYDRIDPSDPLDVGGYHVSSTSSGPTSYSDVRVTARLHFPIVPGDHAVRLIIEGVDSNPVWLEIL